MQSDYWQGHCWAYIKEEHEAKNSGKRLIFQGPVTIEFILKKQEANNMSNKH